MVTEANTRRKWVRWVVPIVTLVLIAIFARKVDWGRAWEAIVHADPLLLGVAALANLASLVVKGVRWSLFLNAAGISGVAYAVRATFAGAALNNVVVANGGDAARVAAVARQSGVSSAAVLATLAVDKLCDLVAYAVLFVAAAFLLPLPPELARWRTPGLLVLAGIVVIVAFLVWRTPDPASSSTRAAHAAEHVTPLQRARAYWHRLAATTAHIATVPRLAIAMTLAFVAWAGQWATFHYAAHAASFPTTPADSLLALLAVNASFLVRLTPGNVGVFQLLYALAATSTGLDKNSAVAVAFLISIIQYVPITSIGLLLARSLTGGSRTYIAAADAPPTADAKRHAAH